MRSTGKIGPVSVKPSGAFVIDVEVGLGLYMSTFSLHSHSFGFTSSSLDVVIWMQYEAAMALRSNG